MNYLFNLDRNSNLLNFIGGGRVRRALSSCDASLRKTCAVALLGISAFLGSNAQSSAFDDLRLSQNHTLGLCTVQMFTESRVGTAMVGLVKPGSPNLIFAGGSWWSNGEYLEGPTISRTDIAACFEGASNGGIIDFEQAGADLEQSFSTQGMMGFSFSYNGASYEYVISGASNTQHIVNVVLPDTEAPQLTSVQFFSDNAALGPNKATVDDMVQVLFSTDEPLAELPRVIIEGGEATVTSVGSSDTSFSATRTIGSLGVDRRATFFISNVKDAANNIADGISETTDGSFVDVDTTRPVPVLTSDATDPLLLSSTDPFTVTVDFGEPVTGFFHAASQMILQNASAAAVVQVSPSIYTIRMNRSGLGGAVQISMKENVVADAFGNQNTYGNQLHFSVVDDVKPRVTIEQPFDSFTLSETPSIDVDISFSEPVSPLAAADVEIENATVTNITTPPVVNEDDEFDPSATRYETLYTVTVTPDGTGNIQISVPADAVMDVARNGNTAANLTTIIMIDDVAPTAVLSADRDSFGQASRETVSVTFAFNEEITPTTSQHQLVQQAITNGTLQQLTFNTARDVFGATILPDGTGAVTVAFPENAFFDRAGNYATEVEPLVINMIDDIPPVGRFVDVPSITNGADAFSVIIEFDEPIYAIESNAFTVVNGTIEAVNILPSAISSLIEGMELNPTETLVQARIQPDGNGDVQVTINEGSVADGVGNVNVAAIGPVTIRLDGTSPTLSSITRLNTPVTADDELRWIFAFSEGIVGFDASDIQVTGATGDLTIQVTSSQVAQPVFLGDLARRQFASGMALEFDGQSPLFLVERASYQVTVSGGDIADGNITVKVSLAETSSIADISGNALTNRNPTGTDESETVVVNDTTPPTILLGELVLDAESGTYSSVITLSEPAVGDLFEASDLTVGNGTATLSGSETSFIATITPTQGTSGEITLDVDAATFTDAADNANTAAVQVSSAFDTRAPTVEFVAVPALANGPFNISVNFSKDVTGLEALDFEVQNASVSLAGGPQNFTLTVTPDGNGPVNISLPAGAAQDKAGIPTEASSANVVVAFDDAAPFIVSVVREGNQTTDADELSWVVTFSEPVAGFDANDLDIEGPEGQLNVRVVPLVDDASLSPSQLFNTVFGVTRAHAQDSFAERFRVTVSGGNIADENLTVTIALSDTSTLQDRIGNSLTDTTPAGTNEAAIVVVNDSQPPSVEVTGPSIAEGPFTVTFTFSEPVTDFDVTDIASVNATVTGLVASNESNGLASVFTALATPVEHGLVTISVNGNAAADAAGNLSFASNTLIVTYTDVSYTETRTSAVINNFLNRRAQNILANEPDLSGRLNEQGGLGATEKFAFRAEGTEDKLSVDFGGSLTRQRLTSPLALGYGDNVAATPGVGGLQKYNIWVRGSLSKYESDGVVQDFGIVHLGADYRINEAFIVGAMVQFDWAEEADPVANTATSGNGWMIGPYAVVRLHDNLIFDGRVAWGQSNNEVSPFGTYTDKFDTDRFLVRGQFTGDFELSGWTVAPQVSLTYISEKQHSYTDSNNITIGSQTVELGQLAFGPKISRTFQTANGTTVSPSFGLKGIWDFKDTGILNIDTGTASDGNGSDLTARIDVGLDINFAQGTTIGFDAFYTGIGESGSEGYGGSFKARVPF